MPPHSTLHQHSTHQSPPPPLHSTPLHSQTHKHKHTTRRHRPTQMASRASRATALSASRASGPSKASGPSRTQIGILLTTTNYHYLLTTTTTTTITTTTNTTYSIILLAGHPTTTQRHTNFQTHKLMSLPKDPESFMLGYYWYWSDYINGHRHRVHVYPNARVFGPDEDCSAPHLNPTPTPSSTHPTHLAPPSHALPPPPPITLQPKTLQKPNPKPLGDPKPDLPRFPPPQHQHTTCQASSFEDKPLGETTITISTANDSALS